MRNVLLGGLVAALCVAGCSPVAETPPVSIFEAAMGGNIAFIEQHIAAGTDLNQQDPTAGSTPLITAAAFGNAAAAKALIDGGASLDIQNNSGSSALMTATFLGHPDIVRMLLDAGADKSLTDPSGATALTTAEAPFESLLPVYDMVKEALTPLGIDMDYDRIKAARPGIAEMLR